MAQFRAQRIESLQNKPVYQSVRVFVERELDELNPTVVTDKTFEECIV